MKKCHYCKDELGPGATDHHICYNPEETVPVCKVCHYRITKMMRYAKNGHLYLCIRCGRHYTSNFDKICFYCSYPDNGKKDCFGLTAKDKTKPIFRYNYHWLKTGWL